MNKSKIDSLSKEIIKHRDLYYNHQPSISDATFDSLCDELKKLDPDNISLTSIGSPINNTEEWKEAEHDIPMGSLDKASTPEELVKWIKESFKPTNSIFLTEKLDGLSIEVIYKEGKLTTAITRGNGKLGFDITRNVIKMSGIKKELPNFTGSLRGEIILKREDHKKYFPDFSNPRNAASGISKRLDGEGCDHLSVLFYQVIGNTESFELGDFKSEFIQFRFIETILGLNVPPYESIASHKKDIKELSDNVIKRWETYHTLRDTYPYEIDGLVIRVNDLDDQVELGSKDQRPKGAIAFKFRSEEAVTFLKDVIWQVGNSGRITPVAIFEQTKIAGVNIERATLHNFSIFSKLKLFKGCRILISRRNDVIPYVEKNLDI